MAQHVFIIGAPRSGTTALTRLVMAHSSVFLADAHNLGTSPDGAATWESGVFVKGLSDDEILRRFEAMSCDHPVILEKTPAHTFHIKRIKRMFPKARFLITHRKPRDCLLSWKVATKTFIRSSMPFRKACKNWSEATRVLIDHHDDPDFLVVDFEDLVRNTSAEAARVFDFIGLDLGESDKCAKAMNDKRTARVQSVIGESVNGGKTRLTLLEQWAVLWNCSATEKSWQSARRI